MGIQFCFSSKPITIMKSLLFVLSLLPLLTQHPRLSLRPKLMPGTDGTTDGADTTATLTDMDTADTGRGKPRLNPLPLLTPMLKPIPLSSTDLTMATPDTTVMALDTMVDTMVDTTDTPTLMDMVWDTADCGREKLRLKPNPRLRQLTPQLLTPHLLPLHPTLQPRKLLRQ